jgi:tight adherence protein B
MIEESGLPLNVGTLVLLCVAAFMLAAAVTQYFVRMWWVIPIAAFAAGSIPVIVVRVARTKRLRKFEEQFPEVVELIARALRAGHAFATGLKLAAEETPEPAGPEFKLLFDRQNYGAPLGDALRSFAQRVPLLDARFFVTAVLTQRETGGNLAEVLDHLAAVMRDRFRIRRDVRTKSAHGRLTAYILAGLPPVLALIMTFLNPQMMRLLIDDPFGVKILVAGATLQVIGTFIVRKLVDIQY